MKTPVAYPETIQNTGFVSWAPVSAPNQPHNFASNFPRVDPLGSMDRRPVSSFSLVLSNDGSGWVGAFGVVLSALLTKLVCDGALEASVTWSNEHDEDENKSGWIVGFDPDTLRIDWADGTVTCGNTVLAIGI